MQAVLYPKNGDVKIHLKHLEFHFHKAEILKWLQTAERDISSSFPLIPNYYLATQQGNLHS